MKISQNFVAFSEYMNFNTAIWIDKNGLASGLWQISLYIYLVKPKLLYIIVV